MLIHPSDEKMPPETQPNLPAFPGSPHFSALIQHILPRPENLRLTKSTHLSGITAENRPGARKTSNAGKTLWPLQSPFPLSFSGAGEGI